MPKAGQPRKCGLCGTVGHYRPKCPGEKAAQPAALRAYRKHGAPPKDPLARMDWANGIVATAMHQAATSTLISEAERRKEITSLAASLTKLIPFSRLKAAEDLIRGDQDALAGGGVEELEDVPAVDSQTLRGPAKRGRPPKRAAIH